MLTYRTLFAMALGCGAVITGCEPGNTQSNTTGPGNAGAGGDAGAGGAGGDAGAGGGGGAGGMISPPLQPAGFEFANGLLPTCFWSHGTQKTLRNLANAPLANAAGTMPAMPDVLPLCYDAIQYTVQCALEAGNTVTNPGNGAVYEGAAGLAPKWRTQPLDADGKRWVTACLVQRLNTLGLKVPILLEGNHSSLYENPKQDAKYPFQESSAFGDLFSSTAPLNGLAPAFTAYVCGEQNFTDVCLNPSGPLNLRLCDNVGLLCGVQYIGKCGSECVADGPYWNCPDYGFSQTIRVQTQDALCL
jgi:hypothetical protein